jgi:hypothetical protein
MNLVLDIQCFKREHNKFVVKELAAYDGEKMSHFLFKQPFPIGMLPHDLQKQVHWLSKHHHCIEWTSGYTPYYYLGDILRDLTSGVDRVYVKGKEKAHYLQKLISKPVIEFDEEPALGKGKPKCFYHSNDFCYCALNIVFHLYENFVMK